MTKIIIDIKSCQECPFLEKVKIYTGDSWETDHDWLCKKNKLKKNEGSVSWNEEKDVEIPKWCPIKK